MKLISLLLVMITLVTFWRVRECEFVSCDDPMYVSENPHIRDGLTWKGIRWAFGADLFFNSPNADCWQPVTFLSRMLDIQLFGLDPSMHHLMNLMFHVLNTLLLFHVLRRMTGKMERSAWVAAFFAVHPLQVEAVAWVTQRKDMLSGFFWMLTIWAYVRYVSAPAGLSRWGRYGVVILMFGLGLMSKPMGVTLPFVLLLLDFWPLKRANLRWKEKNKWGRLIFEKTPLLMLSIICGVLILRNQGSHLHHNSVGTAIGNMLVSYATYLVKTIFPHHLAVHYPHPGSDLPLWQLAGSVLILALISFWVVRWARRRPFYFVGWCWFVGTLVPVVGLNDIARADRFTYLPLVGICIMAVWGAAEMRYGACGVRSDKVKKRRMAPVVVAGVILAAFMIGSMLQLRHWKNSVTLFERVCRVIKNRLLVHFNPYSPKAYDDMGVSLVHKGRINDGIEFYRRALQINPNYWNARFNLADALVEANRMDEAIPHYVQGLSLNPDHAHAHRNFGTVLASRNQLDEAIRHYQVALQLAPDDAKTHYNLGSCLMQQGKLDQARAHLEAAVNLQPDPATAEFARRALDKLRARRTHPAPQP